jgi:hypothetical protein
MQLPEFERAHSNSGIVIELAFPGGSDFSRALEQIALPRGHNGKTYRHRNILAG